MTVALYRNIFKFLAKQSAETITRSESGRLFHTRGAATVNARGSPSDEYMRGTATVPSSTNDHKTETISHFGILFFFLAGKHSIAN